MLRCEQTDKVPVLSILFDLTLIWQFCSFEETRYHTNLGGAILKNGYKCCGEREWMACPFSWTLISLVHNTWLLLDIVTSTKFLKYSVWKDLVRTAVQEKALTTIHLTKSMFQELCSPKRRQPLSTSCWYQCITCWICLVVSSNV